MLSCEYCKNEFVNKYTLKTHINTSKSCLKIQGKVLSSELVCLGCNKIFTQKINLRQHLEICEKYKIQRIQERHLEIVNSLENDLGKKDKFIEYLQKKIEEKDKIIAEIALNKI